MPLSPYFVDRSLASWETAEPERRIKLHDLQLDYVRACFKDQSALKLIHDAMRLGSNVIAHKPEKFASQLVGRLLPHEGMDAVEEFTKDIAEGAPRPWLKPLWPSLHPPGTALIRTLAGHSASVFGVAVTPDGRRAVSAPGDNTLKVWDLDSGAVIAGFTCDGAAECCAFAEPDRILAGDAGGRLHFLKLEMPL